jgi:hypothetical protein
MGAARFVLIALAACAAAVTSCGVPAGPVVPPPASLAPADASPSASPIATGQPPALHQVSDPGQVTGTLTGPCHAMDGGQLPDPSCTPGAYDPAITAAVLCAPGYTTSSYRAPSSQTSAFKYNVAEPAYGQVNVSGELDHLVSLELGGANDASNLWVEPGPIPNPKDTIENALHAWVCAASGQAAETRLHDAQQAIAADWLTAEHVLGIGS